MALFGKKHTSGSTAPASPVSASRTEITAPVAGRAVPLGGIGDRVFATGLMGPGIGIVPSRGEVFAPVAGTVATAFPTGHAYGIRSAGGVDVLVHIGLDTVDLEGRGFVQQVVQGQTVAVGDRLGTVDLDAVRAAGKDPVTIVVITNAHDLAAVVPGPAGDVEPGDTVITVRAETEPDAR
ncbi:MAG TPA: glucose PTS transporter subunit IIA [Cellulomonas sp.]